MERNSEIYRTQRSQDDGIIIERIIYNGVKNAIINNKIKAILYVLGLILLFFFNGIKVDDKLNLAYEQELMKFDVAELSRAQRDLMQARIVYEESLEPFMIFSTQCSSPRCKHNYANYQKALDHFNRMKEIETETLSNARAKVGIFSEYAVADAKDLFWSIISKGKNIAQRSSYYDFIFMGISSIGRDESLASFIIRWIFQVITNLTISLIGAFFVFVYYVGDIIASYQANFFTGALFYFMAILAAASFIISYFIALVAAGTGTIYVVAKAAGPNLRIGYNGNQARFIRSSHRD